MMQSRLIRTDSSVWAETLAGGDYDFFHQAAYTDLLAERESGTAVAVIVEEGDDRLFLPLVLRPIDLPGADPGMIDATSAYGYPGPLLRSRSDDPSRFLAGALEEIVRRLREQAVVSLFVRLHPLFPLPLEPLRGVGGLVHHGEVVDVDLGPTEEVIWSGTRHGHRSDINRARRAGASVQVDDTLRHLADFQRIYAETMDRLGAGPHYHFGEEFFARLHGALGGSLHLATVHWDGDVVAAALFTETKGIVQYFLSGTRTEAVRRAPSKLMLDEVRRWAAARGNRTLFLGGGLGGRDDSLFRFKTGFSDSRRPFHSWRVVLDPVAYARLERAAGVATPSSPTDDFFPSYRRPRNP